MHQSVIEVTIARLEGKAAEDWATQALLWEAIDHAGQRAREAGQGSRALVCMIRSIEMEAGGTVALAAWKVGPKRSEDLVLWVCGPFEHTLERRLAMSLLEGQSQFLSQQYAQLSAGGVLAQQQASGLN
jgi:hypothetical protein